MNSQLSFGNETANDPMNCLSDNLIKNYPGLNVQHGACIPDLSNTFSSGFYAPSNRTNLPTDASCNIPQNPKTSKNCFSEPIKIDEEPRFKQYLDKYNCVSSDIPVQSQITVEPGSCYPDSSSKTGYSSLEGYDNLNTKKLLSKVECNPSFYDITTSPSNYVGYKAGSTACYGNTGNNNLVIENNLSNNNLSNNNNLVIENKYVIGNTGIQVNNDILQKKISIPTGTQLFTNNSKYICSGPYCTIQNIPGSTAQPDCSKYYALDNFNCFQLEDNGLGICSQKLIPEKDINNCIAIDAVGPTGVYNLKEKPPIMYISDQELGNIEIPIEYQNRQGKAILSRKGLEKISQSIINNIGDVIFETKSLFGSDSQLGSMWMFVLLVSIIVFLIFCSSK